MALIPDIERCVDANKALDDAAVAVHERHFDAIVQDKLKMGEGNIFAVSGLLPVVHE